MYVSIYLYIHKYMYTYLHLTSVLISVFFSVMENVSLLLTSFQFNLFGKYHHIFYLNFNRALRDITNEQGHDAFESSCQNVKGRSSLYFTLLTKNGAQIFKYKCHIKDSRFLFDAWFLQFTSLSFMDKE